MTDGSRRAIFAALFAMSAATVVHLETDLVRSDHPDLVGDDA